MIRNRLVLAAVAALTACGGSEAGTDQMQAQAPDTTVRQIEREPLTDADFVDLDRTQLSIEIPWTTNVVERGKAPAAPRSLVESVAVTSQEGFDRTLFTFSTDAPFPGYRIQIVDAGTAVACGAPADQEGAAGEDAEGGDDADTTEGDDHEGGVVPELAGERVLVVHVDPGWNAEGGRTTVPIGTESYDFTRVAEAGVLCSQDNLLTFVAGLSEGEAVRVLELRDPHRLAVDVR